MNQKEADMPTKSIGKATLKTDKDGKVRVEPAAGYSSVSRKISAKKSTKKTVVSRARAGAR